MIVQIKVAGQMAGYIELFRNFCALSAIAVVAPTSKGKGGGVTLMKWCPGWVKRNPQ